MTMQRLFGLLNCVGVDIKGFELKEAYQIIIMILYYETEIYHESYHKM